MKNSHDLRFRRSAARAALVLCVSLSGVAAGTASAQADSQVSVGTQALEKARGNVPSPAAGREDSPFERCSMKVFDAWIKVNGIPEAESDDEEQMFGAALEMCDDLL